MIDWFILAAPLLLIPLVLLLVFSGCALDRSGLGTAVRELVIVTFHPASLGTTATDFLVRVEAIEIPSGSSRRATASTTTPTTQRPGHRREPAGLRRHGHGQTRAT